MGARAARLAGEISAGFTGGVASAAASIPIGLIAIAPLGGALSGAGVLAMFVGTIFGGAVFGLLKRTPGLQAGGDLQLALVISGALTGLVSQGVLGPSSTSIPEVLAVMAVMTILSSLWLAVIWLTGLGRVVPLIPYPVIAGVVNGGVALMIFTQWRHGLGLEQAGPGAWPHPGAVLVTVATAALVLRPLVPGRAVPPVLVALLGGAAVHYAIAAASPSLVGPVLGSITAGGRQAGEIVAAWSMLARMPPGPMLATLLPAALTVAVLATLNTLMGASTMQDLAGAHRSAQPDLGALAIGNLVGGFLAGLPVTAGINASTLLWSAGGRTRLAGFIRLGVMLAIALLLSGAMSRLPFAVVSGIVVANGYRLFDRESIRLARLAWATGSRRGPLVTDLAIIAAVVVVAIGFGMAYAVLAGALLSLVTFAVVMAHSVVRRFYVGGAGRSRTTRPAWEVDVLLARASQIEVVELQGAIFFGSADQVARRVEAALARGARHVILDARRVTSVDLSGGRRLLQVGERFWRDGHDVSLANLRPGTPFWTALQEYGLLGRLRTDRVFAALEEAVDEAEGSVLAEASGPHAVHSATAAGTLQAIGLPARLAEEMAQQLPVVRLNPGEKLLRTGDASDCFFVLLAGSVDVVRYADNAGHRQRTRLATLMPGLLVGEMGFLSGEPRTADAVARTPVSCLRIDAAVMERLRATRPEITYDLMRAIAGQIRHNLLVANTALIALEE